MIAFRFAETLAGVDCGEPSLAEVSALCRGRHIAHVELPMGFFKLLFPRWGRLGRDARVAPRANTRRAQRVLARMPILVYGRLGNEPFAESTQTVDVSALGGLVPIAALVVPSQKLILTNLQTGEDLACRVVRLLPGENGETLVGLEFLQPSPRFWRIDFVAARMETGP